MTLNYRLLIISVLLLLLGGAAPVAYLVSGFHRITFPVQFGVLKMSENVAGEIEFLQNIRGAKKELFELQKIKILAGGLTAKVAELELENKTLRNQLESPLLAEKIKIAAYVSGISFGSSGTNLTLNVGKSSGVEPGFAVVYENYLVGIVNTVLQNSCEVKLLNAPDATISVLSQGSRAKGLVVGNYGTNALMKNILINESINAGDVVITSGEDPLIPKGLVIGNVVKVNFKEEEILKSADVELAVNPRKLEMVFVVTKEYP